MAIDLARRKFIAALGGAGVSPLRIAMEVCMLREIDMRSTLLEE
jgi:hypothetical protein